jgi:DNA-directed RNA polymerase beta' subunit
MSQLVKLSYSEIEDVVNSFPKIVAINEKIANKVREQIQNKIRIQLKDEKLLLVSDPSNESRVDPRAIELLKELIAQQHYNSLVQPGEAVGVRAAESIGQPVTQMALNSFHSAGSSANVSGGIQAVKELYNMSQKRQFESTFIRFKDPYLSFEKAMNLRRKLVGITVKDLVKSKEYISYNPAEESSWYKLYLDIYNKSVPRNTTDFLRLTFDKSKMYAYNVSLEEIVESMESNEIVCIPSPSILGYIDVYPIIDVVNEKNKQIFDEQVRPGLSYENASVLFLQVSFEPSMETTVIHGIDGITKIIPQTKDTTWGIVKYEERVAGKKKQWKLGLDKIRLDLSGIPIEKLEGLLNICKMSIIENKFRTLEAYAIVEMPEKVPTNLFDKEIYDTEFGEYIVYENSPSKYMDKLLKKDTEIRKKEIKEDKIKGIYRPQRETLILKWGYHISAIADGTNLTGVLSHPDIDETRTWCSNPHDMFKSLGIEAARNFLMIEYERVFFDDNYVNPKHLSLVADFQTSLGRLLSITPRSVALQNPGPLAKASFEEPMKAFIEGAAFGKIEDIKNTSTSIFVGKRMIMGTGSFGTRLDIPALERADAIREERRRLCEETQNYNVPDCKEVEPKEDLDTKELEALLHDNNIDDGGLDFTNDGDFANIGLVSLVNLVADNSKKEILKVKNIIPKTKSFDGKISIPYYLKANLYQLSMPKLSPKRAVSPNKRSISKKGLPALPALKLSDFQSMNRKASKIVDTNEGSDNEFSEF